MVVDGRTEFVGSDVNAALAAVRESARQLRVAVRLTKEGSGVTVDVDALPAGSARKASVYIAQALDHATSDVLRGENKGRRLRHIAVVKTLKEVGSVTDRAGYHGSVPAGEGRLVVLVQEAGTGRVWGSAGL